MNIKNNEVGEPFEIINIKITILFDDEISCRKKLRLINKGKVGKQ